MRALINIFATLMLIASLSVSCEGCDRKTTETTENTTGDESRADFNDTNSGTTISSPGDRRNTPAASGRESSAGNNNRAGTNSDKNTGRSKSGYSAPNGTDAENHDGDPYTKHDTTSMPTGTSIR